jgi:lipid A 3-O-deacylase
MKRRIPCLLIAAHGLATIAVASLAGPAAAQTNREAVMLGPIQMLRDEPSYLDLGAGAFNVQGNRDSSATAEARLEFRYGKKLWIFGPAVGVLGNLQGGAYAYGGIYSDLKWGGIVVTPLAGAGAYHRGGSEDLGGVFQFRLSLGIAYEFSNASRIGLQIAHISNANTHEKNPSENELLLTYAIPFP